MMHLCVFSLLGISKDLPSWGGVQTHAENLVSLLLNQGWEVSVITGLGEPVENGPLSIIPVGDGLGGGRPAEEWFKKAGEAFLRIKKDKTVDCVFSEGGGVRGLMRLMRKHRIPVVTFVHSLSMHYFYNKWQEVDGVSSLKSYAFRTLPRIIYDILVMDIAFLRKCQIVVTGSSTIGRQLKKFYRVPHEKVRVIHNWVNPNKFQSDKAAGERFRKDLQIGEDDPVFLLVGSLWRPKGFRTALHAFKDVIKEVPGVNMIVSGEGPDRAYFNQYLSRSKTIRERVKLLGHLNNDKLPLLYSASDIFIIPSIINEVLPYTLLEAMACQLPIIASDIAANKEALGSGGSFFPRGDKDALKNMMLDFVSDLPQKRIDSVLNRQRVLEFFSSETASKKLNKLIKEILGPKANALVT